MRPAVLAALVVCAWPAPARAQLRLIDGGPAGAPLVLELSSLELRIAGSALEARAVLAAGGRLEARGTLGEAGIEAAVEALSVDAASALPWLLRAGPRPAAEGVLAGGFSLRGPLRGPLALEGRLELVSGSVAWAALRLDAPVRFAGRVVFLGQPIALSDVQILAPRVQVDELVGREVEARLAYRGRTLDVDALRFHAFDAAWLQRGRVWFEEEPRFDLAIDAHSAPDAELFAVTPGDKVFGRFESFEGGLRVRGRWTGRDTWLATLEGDGTLRLRGGRLERSAILPAIWNALAGRVPLLKLPRLPRLLDRGPRVEELTSSFRLAESALHTSDLVLRTEDFRLTGHGTLGLDASLALDGRVALTQRGVERMFAMTTLPIPKTRLSLPALPVRIGGTLDDVQVEVDASRVARAPLLAVLKAPFSLPLPGRREEAPPD